MQEGGRWPCLGGPRAVLSPRGVPLRAVRVPEPFPRLTMISGYVLSGGPGATTQQLRLPPPRVSAGPVPTPETVEMTPPTPKQWLWLVRSHPGRRARTSIGQRSERAPPHAGFKLVRAQWYLECRVPALSVLGSPPWAGKAGKLTYRREDESNWTLLIWRNDCWIAVFIFCFGCFRWGLAIQPCLTWNVLCSTG